MAARWSVRPRYAPFGARYGRAIRTASICGANAPRCGKRLKNAPFVRRLTPPRYVRRRALLHYKASCLSGALLSMTNGAEYEARLLSDSIARPLPLSFRLKPAAQSAAGETEKSPRQRMSFRASEAPLSLGTRAITLNAYKMRNGEIFHVKKECHFDRRTL